MNQNLGATAKLMRTAAMVFAAVAIFCGQASAVNDVIAQWSYEVNTPGDLTDSAAGPTVFAEAGAQAGTASMQGVHVSALSDWTTPVGNGSANSYSVTNWAVGDYSQFAISTTGLFNIGS